MNRIVALLLTLLVTGLSPHLLADDDWLITNVNLVPMDQEQILPAQNVLINDGTIARIWSGPVTGHEEVTRIDGSGKYLLPGLTEMHAHIPGKNSDQLDWTLFLYAANGVTTVRGMLGEPWHLQLRDQLASGQKRGPRLVTSGPSFNGRSVNSPAQATAMVESQKAAGYDFLKLHPGLQLDEFQAIAKTANRLEIPFAGHVSQDVGLERALASGQASIDHLDGYLIWLAGDKKRDPGFFGFALTPELAPERIPEIAKKTAATDVWLVPTESLMINVAGTESVASLQARDEMRYVPENLLSYWSSAKREFQSSGNYTPENARRYLDVRKSLIKALHDAGANLVLGSDAPQIFNVPGFSLHRELQIMVDAGLSPFQALQLGTVNAARYFGEEKTSGVIKEGAVADLLLVDANPLEDIGNSRKIAGVMLGGDWLSRERLDKELAKLAGSGAGKNNSTGN